MDNAGTNDEKIKYSKLFSSLFCSASIIALSILCLLNNLSFDIYSACVLLKVVIPAAICFWFIGYSMGHIFDGYSKKIIIQKKDNEAQAYEIPSMFAADMPAGEDDMFGDI